MFTLSNLKGNEAATKSRKRLGRGMGSGLGKLSGKGHKGQKARSGGGIRLAFEGGQTPQYRKLPKFGFKNAPFKKEFAILNLSSFTSEFAGKTITPELVLKSGLVSSSKKDLTIKVLAKGDIKAPLNFKGAFVFSQTAKDKIKQNGGSVE